MNDKLEILLVEDDPISCKEVIEVVDDSDDIILVGVTNSSTQALDYIKNSHPDVIILDLELHNGCGSGINVLFDMKNCTLSKTPYILVTTNNSSQVTHDFVRQFGADFIMSKHQQDYSAKNVINFLRMMRSAIQTKNKYNTINETTNESPEHKSKRITRRIMSELNNVGVNPKSIGYCYLCDAIHITIQQKTQNVCTMISKKYGKTEPSIQRAMQNAIDRAWKTSCIDDLINHYTAPIHSSKGNPTITEFICYYANKLNSEY